MDPHLNRTAPCGISAEEEPIQPLELGARAPYARTRTPRAWIRAWGLAVAASVVLIAWWDIAPLLPDTPNSGDLFAASTLPWIAGAVLVMHGLRRVADLPTRTILIGLVLSGVTSWTAFHEAWPLAIQSSAKLTFAALAGYLIATVAERLAWSIPLAILGSVADLWSVYSDSGFTHVIAEGVTQSAREQFNLLMIQVPSAGSDYVGRLGSVDITFGAMFIGIAHLFRIGPGRTATGVFIALAITGFAAEHAGFVPAVPFMAVAFIMCNARILRANVWPEQAVRITSDTPELQ